VDPAVLESYAGAYKTDQFPIDIKVFVKEGRLYLQATGQPELATKALSATRFAFAPAQIEVEFDSADSFTLKQGGGNIKFKKAVSK
jgi:D-alanyl-D-alanine carboxypeptidase